MVSNRLRDCIGSGSATFGAWLSMGSAPVVEIIAQTQPDWLVLDMQHGWVTLESLYACLLAAERWQVPALVRSASDSPSELMRIADLGAAGVIVPLVESAAQAERISRSLRYPSTGERSFGPIRAGYGAGAMEPPVCFAMIESDAGLENVARIAAVPGIDGLFIGPADLSLSLGLGPLDSEDLSVIAAPVARIVAAAREAGIAIASAAMSPAMVDQLRDLGVDVIPVGGDQSALRRGAAADEIIRDRLRTTNLNLKKGLT